MSNYNCEQCGVLTLKLKEEKEHLDAAITHIKKLEGLYEAANEQIENLKECHMVLEHAAELGYLGEGSTAGMARDALKKCEWLAN